MHAWTDGPFVPSHAVCSDQAKPSQAWSNYTYAQPVYTACACPISSALHGPIHINSLQLYSWVIQTTQFQIISDLPTLPQRHTMLARGTRRVCAYTSLALIARVVPVTCILLPAIARARWEGQKMLFGILCSLLEMRAVAGKDPCRPAGG